jgi:hypothetical protein
MKVSKTLMSRCRFENLSGIGRNGHAENAAFEFLSEEPAASEDEFQDQMPQTLVQALAEDEIFGFGE